MNIDRPSKNSPQPEPHWLTIDDFEYFCFNSARELMSYDEPIPDYNTRDNALLESALGVPRHTFDDKLLYPTLEDQAAALFYSLIKNHAFQNGNKRIAVIALFVFLAFNGQWPSMSPDNLYQLAITVSESDPKTRDTVLSVIRNALRDNLIPFTVLLSR